MNLRSYHCHFTDGKAKPMDEQKDHEKKKYLIQDLMQSVLQCVHGNRQMFRLRVNTNIFCQTYQEIRGLFFQQSH